MNNGLLGTLNIDPFAILINIVGFVLLLWIANKMVFKPIGKVITERELDVNSSYDKLDADRKEMAALREEYQSRLAGIEAQAREQIQNAIKDAQAARDQIITEANERGRELVTRAEREAERERREAMITLRKQIVDLALGATVKIVGDGLDETRQRQLVDNFIASGGSVGPASAVATATPIITSTPPTAEEKPAPRTRRTTAKATDTPPPSAPDATAPGETKA